MIFVELVILDQNLIAVDVIDQYESLIWTDRYYEAGDFEIYTAASIKNLQKYQEDYYIISDETEHGMIIESNEIDCDLETGNHLIVSGRSFESMLERRIVWEQTTVSGSLPEAVRKLLNDNVINPKISQRKISNFLFEDPPEDSPLYQITVSAEYTGDTVYSAIQALCQSVECGFEVILNNKNEFVFRLYQGTDRSYEQDLNPYVIFSPSFDNIVTSDYIESKKEYYNIALVAGEGEGAARTTTVVGDQEATGMLRRELYVDARDINSQEGNYIPNLQQRGEEKLAEHKIDKTFEGEVDAIRIYKYRENFFMGDLVQLESEYGHNSRARVLEFVYSDDRDGIKTYPTFEVLE